MPRKKNDLTCSLCGERETVMGRLRRTVCRKCYYALQAEWAKAKPRVLVQMLWEATTTGVRPVCWRCSLLLEQITATIDHIVPLALGGRSVRSNLRWSCGPCNSSKNSVPA